MSITLRLSTVCQNVRREGYQKLDPGSRHSRDLSKPALTTTIKFLETTTSNMPYFMPLAWSCASQYLMQVISFTPKHDHCLAISVEETVQRNIPLSEGLIRSPHADGFDHNQ